MGTRISQGERKLTAMLAAKQADVDVVRIQLERLRKDAARVVSDLDELLARPPFAGGDMRGRLEFAGTAEPKG